MLETYCFLVPLSTFYTFVFSHPVDELHSHSNGIRKLPDRMNPPFRH